MWFLWMACAITERPAAPGSAAHESLQAQVEAGEHARRMTELGEQIQALLGELEAGTRPADTVHAELDVLLAELAAESAAAQDALDRAEAALGPD